jgi:hypothetical protein
MQMMFPGLFPTRVTPFLLPVSIAHTHLLYLLYSRKPRQMAISCADEGSFGSSAHHLHTSAFLLVQGLLVRAQPQWSYVEQQWSSSTVGEVHPLSRCEND